VAGGGFHVVLIGREVLELERVQRLVGRTVGREGEQVQAAGIDDDRHARHHHRRAHVGDEGEGLVVLHELARGEYRALGVVACVLDRQADPAPMHAAGGVGLVEAHQHAVAHRHAEHGDRAGEVGHGADDDFIGAHPRRHGGQGAGEGQRGGERKRKPTQGAHRENSWRVVG